MEMLKCYFVSSSTNHMTATISHNPVAQTQRTAWTKNGHKMDGTQCEPVILDHWAVITPLTTAAYDNVFILRSLIQHFIKNTENSFETKYCQYDHGLEFNVDTPEEIFKKSRHDLSSMHFYRDI